MRSAIKIILGAGVILSLVFTIINFIVAITCFIHPQQYIELVSNIDGDASVNTIYTYGWICFVLTFLCIISLFIDNHAIKMMNDAYKKSELIPSIVILLISFNFIPALLMIFTPSSKLISSHPYFE